MLCLHACLLLSGMLASMPTKAQLEELLAQQVTAVTARIPVLIHQEVKSMSISTGVPVQNIYAEGAKMWIEQQKKQSQNKKAKRS